MNQWFARYQLSLSPLFLRRSKTRKSPQDVLPNQDAMRNGREYSLSKGSLFENLQIAALPYLSDEPYTQATIPGSRGLLTVRNNETHGLVTLSLFGPKGSPGLV